MRETLLFIKVFLLLAAFVGTSSSHAAKSGNHNLLAASACDCNISVGTQTTADDEKAVATESVFSSIQFISSVVVHWNSPVFADRTANKPFARAPPLSLSA